MTTIQIIGLVFGCIGTWWVGIGATLFLAKPYNKSAEGGWELGAFFAWPLVLPALLAYRFCARRSLPKCRVIAERKGK